MVKIKLLGALFCASMLWAGCSGSQSNNGSNADNKSNSTTSTESKNVTIEDVWKSYLKSEYCVVSSVDADAAIKNLEKQGNNVGKLVLNPDTKQAVDLNAPSTDSENEGEEFESDDSALGYYYDQLGMFDFKDGGKMVVAFSDFPGIGRCTLQLLKYENGKLTRLKDKFPEFPASLYNNDVERFEGDKFVKFKDSEVLFFNTIIPKFTANGFSVSDIDDHTTTFTWNGVSFD